MELAGKIFATYQLDLADRLEFPVQHKQRTTNDGYIGLAENNADWMECSRISIAVLLRSGVEPTATFLCFEIAEEICKAHGWYGVRPSRTNLTDVALRSPIQWLKFRIGGYCLKQMILAGWCRLEHTNEPGRDRVVVLVGDQNLQTYINDYTQHYPFPRWTSHTDDKDHQLIKYSNGTSWRPDEWHFKGTPPLPDERRLWHPDIDRSMREPDQARMSILSLGKPAVYRTSSVGEMKWVSAANKFEGVEYQINLEMLEFIQELDEYLPKGFVEKIKTKNPTSASGKRRKYLRHKFELEVASAKELSKESFYQRIFLDYRGRMFLSRSRLNYQGDDLPRSLIEFAREVEVNETGFEYLLLHASNLHEETGTVEERVAIGRNNLKTWIGYANNKIGTYDEWKHLDDPLLFIRACIELRDATTSKTLKLKKGFKSHLPVEVDQSNSVIQHIAMLYLDRQSAELSNLLEHSDFYLALSQGWRIDENLNQAERRKIIKKIVVARAYGGGKETIGRQLRDLDDKIPFIRSRRDDELVQIADDGMTHLENTVGALRLFKNEVTDLVNRLNLQPEDEIAWSLPTGFECHFRPVGADKDEFKIPKSKDDAFKYVKLVARYPHTGISGWKVDRALRANIVHSIDGTVAQWVMHTAPFDVISIHDSFSSHASNVHDLRRLFRDSLTYIHQALIPFHVFKRDVAGTPLPTYLSPYRGLLTSQEEDEKAQNHAEFFFDVQSFDGSIS